MKQKTKAVAGYLSGAFLSGVVSYGALQASSDSFSEAQHIQKGKAEEVARTWPEYADPCMVRVFDEQVRVVKALLKEETQAVSLSVEAGDAVVVQCAEKMAGDTVEGQVFEYGAASSVLLTVSGVASIFSAGLGVGAVRTGRRQAAEDSKEDTLTPVVH